MPSKQEARLMLLAALIIIIIYWKTSQITLINDFKSDLFLYDIIPYKTKNSV